MKSPKTLMSRKNRLIALGVWLVLLMLVAAVGSGTTQAVSIALLLATVLGLGCYAVFRIMRAIS